MGPLDVFFFFSSRRRHTRSDRDWSSDVCSSDLMKNSELDQILKSAPVPDRPGAYWDQFTRRVMAKTDRPRTRADAETNHSRTEPFWLRSRFQFATVGLGLAIIGLLVGFVLGFWQGRNLSITGPQLAAARKYFQEIETLFPC